MAGEGQIGRMQLVKCHYQHFHKRSFFCFSPVHNKPQNPIISLFERNKFLFLMQLGFTIFSFCIWLELLLMKWNNCNAFGKTLTISNWLTHYLANTDIVPWVKHPVKVSIRFSFLKWTPAKPQENIPYLMS